MSSNWSVPTSPSHLQAITHGSHHIAVMYGCSQARSFLFSRSAGQNFAVIVSGERIPLILFPLIHTLCLQSLSNYVAEYRCGALSPEESP